MSNEFYIKLPGWTFTDGLLPFDCYLFLSAYIRMIADDTSQPPSFFSFRKSIRRRIDYSVLIGHESERNRKPRFSWNTLLGSTVLWNSAKWSNGWDVTLQTLDDLLVTIAANTLDIKWTRLYAYSFFFAVCACICVRLYARRIMPYVPITSYNMTWDRWNLLNPLPTSAALSYPFSRSLQWAGVLRK